MSLVDHTQDIVVPFSLSDVYDALKKALPKLQGFTIDHYDDLTKTAYLKAGVTLFSWGENMTVSLGEIPNRGTAVSILSTPKTGVMFGGAMDMGKNRKNIELIMGALSTELSNYSQINMNQTQAPATVDTEKELRGIKSLLDDGIITQEEFDAKKKQILGI